MNVTPVGLLTSRQHPLLPYFLDHLETLRNVEPILIFDEKDFSDKDAKIFADRTEGAFPRRAISRALDKYRWVDVPNHNGSETRAFIKENGIGLLVNAGTPRIIQTELISAAPIGILNVHPGILPKYRGASCCEWAIYNDDPVGVTAHFMDAGLDSGPIIFSRELPITEGQTYTDVRVALYHLAHEMRVTAIQAIVKQGLSPAKLPAQPEMAVFKPIPDELLELVKAKLAKAKTGAVDGKG